MRNRIFCVFLSVFLGIGVFSSSLSASAVSASGVFDFIVDSFIPFIGAVKNNDEQNCLEKTVNGLTPEGQKARAYVLSQFKPFQSNLPSDLSKEDFIELLLLFKSGDWSVVEEKYGSELAIYVQEHSGEFLDFMVGSILPLFNGLEDFVNALYDSDLSQYNLDDDGNPQIPADDFKDMIKDRDVYYPTGNYAKYSYRKLSDNYFNTAKNVNVKYFCGPVVKVGQEFTVLMYMERNGKTYYSPFQYHFTCRTETVPADFTIGGEDRSRIHYKYYCDVTYYKSINGQSADNYDMGFIGEVTSQWKSYTYKDETTNSTKTGYKEHFPAYIVLGCGYDNNSLINLAFYETTSDASISSGSFGNIYPGSLTSCDIVLFAKTYNYLICSSDTSDYYLSNGKLDYNGETRYGLGHFFGSKSSPASRNQNLVPISMHDYGDDKHSSIAICDEGHTCDFGYLVSSSSFGSTTTIDTSLIPDNATVTLTGDDLSKYVVTYNNGDTITIGQLIYGGYTPSGGGDTTTSGSVGIGGDVNVGGHVDVSGNVNVNGNINGQINVSIPDINVNVNGGGGTNIDTSMPNLDAVQGYLDEANNESSDFKSFLKDFFSFLPNDILLLLLIALSVCIVCRIVGR